MNLADRIATILSDAGHHGCEATDGGGSVAACVGPVCECRVRARAIIDEISCTAGSPDMERLATWMIVNDFATGHGDTMDDLLGELLWQVKELRDRAAHAP